MLRIADHWHGSDLGLQRQGNEDNYFVRAPLFVVADGMGGAQAGEVASEMAVDSFNAGIPDGDSPSEGLKHIIEEANRRIHERSRSDNQRAGMGTTVTAAYVGENLVTVAHVGDSRCYLVRDGVAYDLSDGAVLGRGDQVDIQLEDSFASTAHARLMPQGDVVVLEDLGSTNGTYLNGEPLRGPQPLHVGDRIRIGDSEFTFER